MRCGKMLWSGADHRWRMRIACWIPKATIHRGCVKSLFFHCNNGCTIAHQCYVIRTLPAFYELAMCCLCRRHTCTETWWRSSCNVVLIKNVHLVGIIICVRWYKKMHAMDNFKIVTNSFVTLRCASYMFRSLHDYHQGGLNNGMEHYVHMCRFPTN